ncbi:MAG: pilus assembly protein PilM [Candidatus Nomurabacteria bacterium]|nr:pilus assembly protein PilM [Candidatus Nomurabacteria bacterium]
MSFLSRFLKPTSTGISITDTHIRFATFSKTKTVPRLVNFGSIPLDPGVIVRGEIMDAEKFITAMEHAGDSGKIRRANIGISDRLAYSFTVSHVKNGNDWDKAIRDKISDVLLNHHRDDLDDSMVEYEITEETPEIIRAFVWAIPRQSIDGYQEICRLAGVRVQSVQTNMYHVASRCAQGTAPGTCMFVDVGLDRSHIAVAHNGQVKSLATVPIGGSSIQPMIDEYLKLHPEKSVEFESSIGMSPVVHDQVFLEKMSRAIAPLAEHVTRERVKWDEGPEPSIDRIHLMGEHAHHPGLQVYLSRLTDTPAKHLDIWGNEYRYNNIPEISFDQSLKYASAIALAMQGVEE